MIHAIVFDWGRVIGQWKDQGRKLDDIMNQELSHRTGTPIKQLESTWSRLKVQILTGRISMDEFWNTYARDLDLDPHVVEGIWMTTFKTRKDTNHDMLRLVRRLQNHYTVALCTNTIKAFAEIHKTDGDYALFEHIIVSCDIGIRKPDRAIYEYVLCQLDVQAGECVFIDDREENVDGARKAGMHAILFNNVTQLTEALKRYGVHRTNSTHEFS